MELQKINKNQIAVSVWSDSAKLIDDIAKDSIHTNRSQVINFLIDQYAEKLLKKLKKTEPHKSKISKKRVSFIIWETVKEKLEETRKNQDIYNFSGHSELISLLLQEHMNSQN